MQRGQKPIVRTNERELYLCQPRKIMRFCRKELIFQFSKLDAVTMLKSKWIKSTQAKNQIEQQYNFKVLQNE